MAQFISPNPKIEVHKFLIATLLEVIGGMSSNLESLLHKEGLSLKNKEEWYKMQNYFNVLKSISKEYSPNALFKLGKSVGKSLQFPSKVNTIQKAFEILEESMQNIHQKGNIGSYKLIKFEKARQEAHFECENPYPRGLLTQVAI